MTQHLRASTTFAKNKNLVQRSHLRQLITTCDSTSRSDWTPSLAPLDTYTEVYIHTYIHRQIKNIKLSFKMQYLFHFCYVYLWDVGYVHMGIQVPIESRRGLSDPVELELHVVLSWGHRCLKTTSGPLQEQDTLLTAGPSLQSQEKFRNQDNFIMKQHGPQ